MNGKVVDQPTLFDSGSNTLVNSLFRRARVLATQGGKIDNPHLSPKEIEALKLIVKDITVPDVAKLMGVSVGYINNLTYSARKRMGTHSTIAAYQRALELGIIRIEIKIPEHELSV